MEISLIWAMGLDGVIGKGGTMPWHLPRDFAFFKERTMGRTMLMGRKTWDSLGGKPLPGRTSIVLTRDASFSAEGAKVVHSLEEALQAAGDETELMVIGGAEIYKITLPVANRLIVTLIEESFDGDTFFPEIDWSQWTEVSSEPGIRDEKNRYGYRFVVYERLDRNTAT
ncbi:dihydrofolate reductase [Paenibacillus sp. HN-1]|uniref:dihydrofolate reductase n=1 Tax=Paenibacillus TaxID=44249 RepID=UPI001CA95C51|nr:MULTISPECIES: dihydrofolate reductase [Paenibacillus]MBY9082064.1 dihydrofolate reductase [Paenibacillus sp. CGMCC 1.18879]MBY9085778.1 dihydrofolate reductase [Paenibacillus sinensis]